jgi:hypothetical protein
MTARSSIALFTLSYEFVHCFKKATSFNCLSASFGSSQNLGACVFNSSSSIWISLFSMSKIPPKGFFAFFKLFKLFCCYHDKLFFRRKSIKIELNENYFPGMFFSSHSAYLSSLDACTLSHSSISGCPVQRIR